MPKIVANGMGHLQAGANTNFLHLAVCPRLLVICGRQIFMTFIFVIPALSPKIILTPKHIEKCTKLEVKWELGTEELPKLLFDEVL